jgi:phospholipid/cholesterol/gamma-HCH transport system substrate-binding protein
LPANKIHLKISRETKVGLFTFTGIIALIVGYNYLKGISFLMGTNQYYVVYDNVQGIVSSTQVTINGYKVGQVEKISMLRTGDASRMLVTMMMDNDVQLPKGTTATISSQDLLGTKVIAITLSRGTDYYQSGDTLVAGVEESLTSTISGMVSPLKEKSEQVLVTLDRVLQSMNDIFDSTGTQKLSTGITDFSGALGNMRKISDRFDRLSEEEYDKLQKMFRHSEAILANLSANNENISKALQNLSRITDSLAASDLRTTIANTSKVMAEFNITLSKINRGEGTLGQLANDKELYVNLNKASAELSNLMKDMQEYPGRYFSVSVFGGSKRPEKQDKLREERKQKK